MNNLTSQINLTDEQINRAFAALGCYAEVDCDPEFFTVTTDTLADFREAAKGYAEGRVTTQTATELVISGAQVKRGEQRRDLFVIDFGAVRVACRF